MLKHAHATISEWQSNSILCVYLDVLLYFSVNPHANWLTKQSWYGIKPKGEIEVMSALNQPNKTH